MPSYSREAVSEAVGSVLDSMFGDQAPSGPRSIAVEFSGDGSRIVVGNVVSEPEEVMSGRDFARAFETFHVDEEIAMLNAAAAATFPTETVGDDGCCRYCLQDPCVLQTEYDALLEIGSAMEHRNCPNNEIRFAMYRHMSNAIHGHLGAGNRRQLPNCVEFRIRNMYPDERYVGYRPAGSTGDEDNEEETD